MNSVENSPNPSSPYSDSSFDSFGNDEDSLVESFQSFLQISGQREPQVGTPPPTFSDSLFDESLLVESVQNCIQINGRRVMGPPPDWTGPPPPTCCELFVKKIPRDFSETELVPIFARFGPIYEFRLMMDYDVHNRGFAYVRYTSEFSAMKALELLNYFYIQPGKTLEVQRSYDKCRLFVGNIPKNLPREEIERTLRQLFPDIVRSVIIYTQPDGALNRGFCFIDFADHSAAVHAKQLITPGRCRLWDREIKIVWANPERVVDPSVMKTTKTLFVRNVHLTINTRDITGLVTQFVDRRDLQKVSRVRELAFLDFYSRESAERVLKGMQGAVLKNSILDLEWAMPPTSTSIHGLKNNDCDAILRLKCIANNWSTPIILYGRVFARIRVQYLAIFIKKFDKWHTTFMEISLANLDIQSRACEVMINLIKEQGDLPPVNYILKIEKDVFHFVGIIQDLTTMRIIKADAIDKDIFLFLNEIYDLSVASAKLMEYSIDTLTQMYLKGIHAKTDTIAFLNFKINDRIIGCLPRNHRNHQPLQYDLPNEQILFVLCDLHSATNYHFMHSQSVPINFRALDLPVMKYFNYRVCHNMLPITFLQPRNYTAASNAVYFGLCKTPIPMDLPPPPQQSMMPFRVLHAAPAVPMRPVNFFVPPFNMPQIC